MITTISDYCSEEDIANRLSIAGVALRVDDIPPEDLGDAIDRASIEVFEHLGNIYDDSELNAAATINRWASDIATYFVCTRRGNPAPSSVVKAYERAIEKLEKYQTGRFLLPDASPRAMAAPSMQNHGPRLTPAPHIRVQRKRSTGKAPTEYQRRVDYADPAEWGALDWNI